MHAGLLMSLMKSVPPLPSFPAEISHLHQSQRLPRSCVISASVAALRECVLYIINLWTSEHKSTNTSQLIDPCQPACVLRQMPNFFSATLKKTPFVRLEKKHCCPTYTENVKHYAQTNTHLSSLSMTEKLMFKGSVRIKVV